MDKITILNNVEDLNVEQLANCIKQEIVSLKELQDTGFLDNSKKNAIKKQLEAEILREQEEIEKKNKADDEAYEKVKYSNEISVITDWINTNPDNRNVKNAKFRVNSIIEEKEKIINEKQNILNNIRQNPNSYFPHEIEEFLKNGTFNYNDLLDCGIPKSAIENLKNIKSPPLNLGKTPNSIPEGYTEVYFWGFKGSGKTTALGAILHMAEKNGYLNIAAGPGNRYATELKNIFSDDGIANDFLPAPTPLEVTQYLPFTLKKSNENKSRSVSLIEVSGEIFSCFTHNIANQPFPTKSHEDTFNSLNEFLRSGNRKIHFFFVDYEQGNKSIDGLKQSDYLSSAATYFNNHDIFKKTTDAIFVVLTKSDLMRDENDIPIPENKRVEFAIKHLNGHNYLAFVNALKYSCKKHSINGGKLTVEPFSLGKVYFKEICDFDGSAASKIIEILMNRISPTKNSILGIFNR